VREILPRRHRDRVHVLEGGEPRDRGSFGDAVLETEEPDNVDYRYQAVPLDVDPMRVNAVSLDVERTEDVEGRAVIDGQLRNRLEKERLPLERMPQVSLELRGEAQVAVQPAKVEQVDGLGECRVVGCFNPGAEDVRSSRTWLSGMFPNRVCHRLLSAGTRISSTSPARIELFPAKGCRELVCLLAAEFHLSRLFLCSLARFPVTTP